MVLIHRWSLYAGSIAWKVYLWVLVKCGLYKQVVFIYRWSLEQVALTGSTLNLRPYFAGSVGGLKMEGPLYIGNTVGEWNIETKVQHL